MSPCALVGSARARYLVFFQYLGTNFNGVAAVRGNQRAVGVLNFLEEAAEGLKSVEPVRFTVSSRTDAGVHALSNAAHLDIQRLPGLPPFSPEVVTQSLNTHLKHPAIRVLKAFRVPSNFHARHAATSRTYLYRLATGCAWPDQLPVFEQNVCWGLQTDCLDEAAMQEAAQHLLGTHDFSAFQSAGSPTTSSMRTLHRVCLSPGLPSPFVLPKRAGTEDDSCAGGSGVGDSDTYPGKDNSGESRSLGQVPVSYCPSPWPVPEVSTVWKPWFYLLHPIGSQCGNQMIAHSSRCEEPQHTKSDCQPCPTSLCSAKTKPHPVLPSLLLPLALISPILPPWTLLSL